MSIKTHSVLPSSRSFYNWLKKNRGVFTSEEYNDFVERYLTDANSPRSIGPQAPTVLLNYVTRRMTKGTRYNVGDYAIIVELWELCTGELEK